MMAFLIDFMVDAGFFVSKKAHVGKVLWPDRIKF